MTFIVGALVLGATGWILYVSRTILLNERAIEEMVSDLTISPSSSSGALDRLTSVVERLDEGVIMWTDLFAQAANRMERLIQTVEDDDHKNISSVKSLDTDGTDYDGVPNLLLASSLTAPLSETDFLTSYHVSSRLQRIVLAPRPAGTGSSRLPSSKGGSPLRLLGLDREPTAVFCVPVLEPRDNRSSALGRTATQDQRTVAVEDVLATKITLTALLSDWPVEADEPGLVLVDPNTRIDREDRNVFSFCSLRRNPITGWLLAEDGPASAIGVRLVTGTGQDGHPVQWIDFDGTRLDSPSRQQAKDRRAAGIDLFDRPVDDYALIARIPNRLDPTLKSKAVIVAGLRAFGTWGAAEFLASRSDELLEKTGGRDFAAVVRVQARTVRVGSELRYEARPEVEVTEYLRAA